MSTEGRSSGCGEGRGWWRGPDVPVETAAESLRVASPLHSFTPSSLHFEPSILSEFLLSVCLLLLSHQVINSSIHFLISVLYLLFQVRSLCLLGSLTSFSV